VIPLPRLLAEANQKKKKTVPEDVVEYYGKCGGD